jgi:hypothetical protein
VIRTIARAIVAVAFLSVACSSAPRASATSTPTPTPTPTRTIPTATPKPPSERQLAIIDENRGGTRVTDAVVRGIRQQMDRIQARCDIDDVDLSDAAVQAQNILRDRSINERLPVILTSWSDTLVARPASAGVGKWSKKDCVDSLTVWIFVRTGRR